ncbi:hypothetical protein ACIGO8_29200 [Streptomyces sp. NPDC053493]|uniref:hypothetical protein n=1 Tax=Streptomyces sp. NPDC053493 TaxID=3365705 RepID=UPI0037D64336
MTAGDGADVEQSALTLPRKLATGGQGEVHEVGGPEGLLFKKYLEPHKVDGAALAALVALRQGLAPADRQRLDRDTAWPLCRVTDGGRTAGFLMRRAPAAMTWRSAKGDGRLIELSYLLRPPKAAWQAVRQPTPAERYALVVSLVDLFQWLHTMGLVVGDLSQANVLWSVDPHPAVHLLDCDGARITGRPPVLAQADTPDWLDPKAPPGMVSVDSDRYKAALMIGRILAQDAYVTPAQPLSPLAGLLDERRETAVRRLWELADGPYGTRPDLGQWRTALAGRDTIRLIAAQPAPRPAVDRSRFDEDVNRRRGTIRLRSEDEAGT